MRGRLTVAGDDASLGGGGTEVHALREAAPRDPAGEADDRPHARARAAAEDGARERAAEARAAAEPLPALDRRPFAFCSNKL